ncbi:MAG TPA: DUF6152 family protein [Steroidobacteraceae bacterium]|jgi:hypothetical protein|nr:DUF6152 family protein [Steroidobacteraceae bacterium]
MKVRMDRVARIAAALATAVAISAPAWAHHAFQAEFDGNQPLMLQGKVTKVEWINPHTWVHMVVVTSGVSQEWMVEAGTPNTLLREGLTRDSLKPGEEIIVRGYRAKDARCRPACKANGRDVTFTDGRKVFMGSSGTGAPKDGADPNEK